MTAAAVFVLSGLSGCHGKGQDTEGAPVVLEDASGEDGKEAKDGGVRDAGEDEQKESPKEAADSIVVYVCGKVRKEGVVTLPAGSRIYQAIEMAGGWRTTLQLISESGGGADGWSESLCPWNR